MQVVLALSTEMIHRPNLRPVSREFTLTADDSLQTSEPDAWLYWIVHRRMPQATPDDLAVRTWLWAALHCKPLEHPFHVTYQPCRPMTAIGG